MVKIVILDYIDDVGSFKFDGKIVHIPCIYTIIIDDIDGGVLKLEGPCIRVELHYAVDARAGDVVAVIIGHSDTSHVKGIRLRHNG